MFVPLRSRPTRVVYHPRYAVCRHGGQGLVYYVGLRPLRYGQQQQRRRGGIGLTNVGEVGNFEVKNRNSTETLQVAVYNQIKGTNDYERVNQNEMQRGFFGREKVTLLPPNSKSARIFYARARDFGIKTFVLWRAQTDAPWPPRLNGAMMSSWARKQPITFPTLLTVELR